MYCGMAAPLFFEFQICKFQDSEKSF